MSNFRWLGLDLRSAALVTAYSVVREQWPRTQVYCTVRGEGPNVLDATAAFHLPGILRVTLRYSGELIAQSRPGQPTVLDTSLFPDDR
ncbi:hypothetical protein [Aquabacterium sp.]|uniref:hypothetical protein n=1 Tax=Aquabacterium sp. TaxID=1872578 RepID=UPI00378521DC